MTLIAGFRSYDAPVLIGDSLLTHNGIVSGLRKKVIIVTSNFALAWTGNSIAADSVVKSLQSSLDFSAVTFSSVKAILTEPETSDLGTLHVSLVCWVLDDQGQHCFRWNSSYPKELFLGEPMYDGSGDTVIEALAGTGLRDTSRPDCIDPMDAARGALQVTTRLMATELLGPSTRDQGFGFSYEIILANKHKFEYIDDILYLAITHNMDNAGKYLTSHFKGSVCKYRNRENYSLIDFYDPNRNAHNVHIVRPCGRQSNEALDALLQSVGCLDYRFPFLSQHYCVFSQFNAPGFKCPPIVMLHGNDVQKERSMFQVTTNNELLLRVNTEMIEWIYRSIREDQES